MTDSQKLVYVVLDWETKLVKGVYPERQDAADARFVSMQRMMMKVRKQLLLLPLCMKMLRQGLKRRNS